MMRRWRAFGAPHATLPEVSVSLGRHSRLALGALGLTLALMLAFAPAAAFAVSGTAAPLAADVAAQRARADQLTAQLARMRSDLATKVADFENANTALATTQQDIADTNAKLTDIMGTLAEEQAALRARAMHMYETQNDDLIEVILGTRSLTDLITRIDYLMLVSDYDAQLVDNVKAARDQAVAVQQRLEQRQAQLDAARKRAQTQYAQLQTAIAAQSGKVDAARTGLTQLLAQQSAMMLAAANAPPSPLDNTGSSTPSGSAAPADFSPNTIISDANFTNASSMSAADVQAFLAGQPCTLKSYRAPDHNGARKTAARMIADAAAAWGVSPRVILVTLQKEQSIIANPNPTGTAYDWAMGCGKTDSQTFTKYRGFGNQVWFGAKTLAHHRSDWQEGASLSIDGRNVYPTNASTMSLYVYTPHFGGNTSFWTLYWRYFGSPL
jgi:peptidoglycan hydrolase CwlO-like protein